ncbi:SDR family oxidoreductase [Salisaeta longa]|uniref:SDR family oxidoreductase n=1 Tax=Salisaeta longa TaxID=503170 RepID=UPI0003B37FC6|nr:SDR family oxidoreductase [Salisaeta longa]
MPDAPLSISVLGCGWLGRPLAAAWAADGYTVYGATTTEAKLDVLRGDGIRPVLCRLEPEVTGEAPERLFDADVLVLNVPPSRAPNDPAAYHAQQVQAVARAAREGRTRWIVMASSTGVYPPTDGPVTEADAWPDALDALPPPRRATSRAVRAAEQTLWAARDALDITIVRLAGLYGGDRHPARYLAGRANVSRPQAPVNLIHRDDCIGLLRALVAQDARNDVFNACADRHPARADFYPAAARAMDLAPPTFDTDDEAGGKRIVNDKIKARLGYTFQHPDPMADVAGRA